MNALFTQPIGFAQAFVTRLWETWEKGDVEERMESVFQIS
jgi:hypothetical protein